MMVKTLIEILQKFPELADVVIITPDLGSKVFDIATVKEGCENSQESQVIILVH